MAKDQSLIRETLARNPLHAQTAALVDRAGFKVTSAVGVTARVCAIYARPNRANQHLFGVTREVLVWTVDFQEFEARNVTDALDHVARSGGRLEEDFLIVVTRDPATQTAVEKATERLAGQFHTHVVGLSANEVSSMDGDRPGALVGALQRRFYARDLYDIKTAIVAPVNYFGRRSVRNQVVANTRDGQNIGVFGLRKMGKTSLLYRLVEALQSDARALYAHVDMQLVEAVDPSAEYLMWTIGERLLDANPHLRKQRSFRLFGQYDLYSDIPDPTRVAELFARDLNAVLTEGRYYAVLLIDEVELMDPERVGASWSHASFVKFWRVVRGLSQQHPHRLAVYITGTNPRCIEANRIGANDNPIYNFFNTHFLGPLSSSENEGECGELLRTLGKKMGLLWSDDAVMRIEQLVGGHPYLLRAFASAVHSYLADRTGETEVDRGVIDVLVGDFLRSHDADFSQLVDVLAEQYPNEHLILTTLAEGKIGEFRGLAEAFPADTSHLRAYGLIDDHLAGAGLRIELLQSWFQRRMVSGASFASGEGRTGETLGPFRIVESIGRKGGFGKVYKAVRHPVVGTEEGAPVALKVLHSGNLSKLQREVDVLKSIDHPNVVRFLDHGQIGDGRLYIAMEFVAGHTLAQYCSRASRASPEGVVEIADTLLQALAAIHPDERALKDARNRAGEMSMEEYMSLNQARHGHVHRDVKPDNVIVSPSRGPVLIDFGISVQASADAHTQSATPGYLPPDAPLHKWTPDVDLYQLGLTMLQVATGLTYSADNLTDLQAAAEELPTRLRKFLLKATHPEAAARFSTAHDARDGLLAGV